MKQMVLVFFAAMIIVACNNSSGWTAAQKQEATKSCMNSVADKLDDATAKKYCSCVLEKMMQKYPTYAQADKEGTEEVGIKIGQACAAEINLRNQGNTDDNGNGGGGGIFGGGGMGGGWSSADKEKFMNTCLQNAMNAGGDEQTARAHCDCTLKKIAKKYKSYTEADQKMTQAEVTAFEQQCNQEQNGGNQDQ